MQNSFQIIEETTILCDPLIENCEEKVIECDPTIDPLCEIEIEEFNLYDNLTLQLPFLFLMAPILDFFAGLLNILAW